MCNVPSNDNDWEYRPPGDIHFARYIFFALLLSFFFCLGNLFGEFQLLFDTHKQEEKTEEFSSETLLLQFLCKLQRAYLCGEDVFS